jgi:hypothetical protein
MEGLGYGIFHCPRCGTVKGSPTPEAVFVPALVERCRQFHREALAARYAERLADVWHRVGMDKAISMPENRK